MTNVDRLSEAGLVESSALSPEHMQFLNNELTTEEIDSLIQIKQKFEVSGPGGYHHTKCCTLTITV